MQNITTVKSNQNLRGCAFSQMKYQQWSNRPRWPTRWDSCFKSDPTSRITWNPNEYGYHLYNSQTRHRNQHLAERSSNRMLTIFTYIHQIQQNDPGLSRLLPWSPRKFEPILKSHWVVYHCETCFRRNTRFPSVKSPTSRQTPQPPFRVKVPIMCLCKILYIHQVQQNDLTLGCFVC